MYFESDEESGKSLGADDFNPILGATLKLNRYAFTTSQANGKWTREGDVWKFKTEDSMKPSVLLKLDFGKGSWEAVFKADSFHHLLTPQWGKAHIQVLVGGVVFYSQEHTISDYLITFSSGSDDDDDDTCFISTLN